MNSEGGQEGRGLVWFDRFSGRPDRRPRLPPIGIWAIDTCPWPGYPYFVGGRVDCEPEAGAFMPRVKSKFLSIRRPEPTSPQGRSPGGARRFPDPRPSPDNSEKRDICLWTTARVLTNMVPMATEK